MEKSLIRFGQNVRAMRTSRGWTQEELSERSGLASVQVSRIERGKREPRISTLLLLMRAFGVSADELLKGVRPPSRG